MAGDCTGAVAATLAKLLGAVGETTFLATFCTALAGALATTLVGPFATPLEVTFAPALTGLFELVEVAGEAADEFIHTL